MFEFPEKRQDEIVLSVIRKHPVVYVKIVMGFVALVILPLAVFFYFWFSVHPFNQNQKLHEAVIIVSSLYFLYSLLYACIKWINEEFDIFIVTNERLIDIAQVSFFRRTIAATPLEHIQDTTSNVSGFVPTLFNYGDLTVKTAAGMASEFFIDRIPDPDNAARNILNWVHERQNQLKGGE